MRSQVGKWLEFIRIDDFCHSKQCRRNSASILPGCAAAGDDEDEDDDDDEEDDDEDDVVDDDDDGDGDDGGDDDEDDEDDDNTDGDADEWMLDTKDTLPRAEVLLFFSCSWWFFKYAPFLLIISNKNSTYEASELQSLVTTCRGVL